MDKEKLLELLERNPQAGELSDEEINLLLEGLAELNENKADPDASENNDKDYFDEGVWSKLNGFVNQITSSPVWRAKLEAKQRESELNKLSEKVRSGLQLALGAFDIGVSASQIGRSEKKLDEIEKPVKPRLPFVNKNLQQALRRSKARLSDPTLGGEIAPARQANMDAFLQDAATAKTVSKGQPALYGALMQSAVNRRYKNNLNMVPYLNQIRRQEEAAYNRLLERELTEDQNRFYRNMTLFDRDIGMFNRDNQAAGNLGRIGRMNLRRSLGNMVNYASPYVADAFMRLGNNPNVVIPTNEKPLFIDTLPTMNKPVDYSPLGEDYLTYKNSINNSLMKRFR